MTLRRLLGTALATAALILPAAAPASAATPVLNLASIAFDREQIDVTQDYGIATLTWTITDRAARAQRITGAVELRQFAGDRPIGQPHTVDYDLAGGRVSSSGTAQQSTYVYYFPVPQYSAVAESVWRVTRVTIRDDRDHTRTIRDPGPAVLASTQLADTEGPATRLLYLNSGREFYDDGSGVTLTYRAQITDDSGFKKGRITVSGPDGRRVSTTFELEPDGERWTCNGVENYEIALVSCAIPVVVPAGSPSGSWRVSRFDLTDVWGTTRSDLAPSGPAVAVVSRNDTVRGSDFALTDTELNTWREDRSTTLTFRPSGAVGGLASVDLNLHWCSQPSRTAEIGDDGLASVRIVFPSGLSGPCQIWGIKLTDGAGHVAYYGTTYGGAELGLAIARTPDRTAPVVQSAALPQATWTSDETGRTRRIGFDVTVERDEFAPISQFTSAIYDSSGRYLSGSSGGVYDDDATGVFHFAVSTDRLEPGTYTIAFTLTDGAGNRSVWGYPSGAGQPVPGGPLTVTVVAG